jgi:hypothetical protein
MGDVMTNSCDVSTSFVICTGVETCEHRLGCEPNHCVHSVKWLGGVRFCNSRKAIQAALNYAASGDCHNCANRPFNKHKHPCYDCETSEGELIHWKAEKP